MENDDEQPQRFSSRKYVLSNVMMQVLPIMSDFKLEKLEAVLPGNVTIIIIIVKIIVIKMMMIIAFQADDDIQALNHRRVGEKKEKDEDALIAFVGGGAERRRRGGLGHKQPSLTGALGST